MYGGHVVETGTVGTLYLAERFLPALREAGVDEATLETLTVENPRRWLTIARAAPPATPA
jgi:predicted metal-dependent phosphotriesterase family hydrolase